MQVVKFFASMRVLCWLAALGCASVASAVQAASTNLPDHGGPGGNNFSIDCGADGVLVGVRARKGAWLDQITGICVRLAFDRRWLPGSNVTATAGEDGGDEIRVVCPENTAVRALRGRFGSYVNRLILRCRPLITGVAARTLYVEGSQRGDFSWSYEFCPGNSFARGFHGRAGSYIDSAGLICHDSNAPITPILQGRPDNLVAVNLVDPQVGPNSTVPTPFVQAQWTDRSTAETGFRVSVVRLGNDPLTRVFTPPAAPQAGTLQRLTITDLPPGQYILRVCALFGTQPLCSPALPTFFITAGAAPDRGAPTNLLVERIGASLFRVRWSHSFVDPSRFDIRSRCGNSALGTVASTVNGAARQENFNVGVGDGQVQVCAQYLQPDATLCSALLAFQCN